MKQLLAILLLAPLLLASCQSRQPYRFGGPGETWRIVAADDEDAAQVARNVGRQRDQGWTTHLFTTSHDEQVKDFIVSPLAFAGNDPDAMTINVWLFADPPVTGRVIIEATPEDGAILQSNWNEPLVFPATMTKGWHSQDLILPQFHGPTESAHIRWITDAPTAPDKLESSAQED